MTDSSEAPAVDYAKLETDAAWHKFFSERRLPLTELRLRKPGFYQLVESAFRIGYAAGVMKTTEKS